MLLTSSKYYFFGFLPWFQTLSDYPRGGLVLPAHHPRFHLFHHLPTRDKGELETGISPLVVRVEGQKIWMRARVGSHSLPLNGICAHRLSARPDRAPLPFLIPMKKAELFLIGQP